MNHSVSTYSNIVQVDPGDWSYPASPVNLSYQIDVDQGLLTVAWKNASDNESGYEVLRSIDHGEYEPYKKLSFDQTSFVSDYAPDKAYSFGIRAVNAFGASAYAKVEIPAMVTATETVSISKGVYPNPFSDKLVIQVKASDVVVRSRT